MHSFEAKSQTLNVPSMPCAERIRSMSTPSAGNTRSRIPVDVPSAGYGGPASSLRSGHTDANDSTFSSRQRSHASPGDTPDSSIARLKVPPDVPSAWWKRSPASWSATSTPAW